MTDPNRLVGPNRPIGAFSEYPNAESVRRCLDTETVCASLNRHVAWPNDTRVTDVRVKRFLPGKARQTDIEYEVSIESPGRPDLWIASVYARHPVMVHAPILRASRAQRTAFGLRNLYFVDTALDLTIHSLDCDPALPHVRQCLDPCLMSDRLAFARSDPRGALAANVDPAVCCEPLAFRRGKRLVVRYGPVPATNGHGTRRAAGRCALIGKSYVDQRGRQLADWQRELAEDLSWKTNGTVRVPHVVAFDDELNMVVTAWAGPSRDSDTKATGTLANGPTGRAQFRARRAAQAIAAIHGTPLIDLPEFDLEQHWRPIQRWSRAIASLRPDLAQEAAAGVEALADAQRRLSPPTLVPIHRDFYEAQLIIRRRTVTVVDLDTLAIGDRCVDAGNYLAHQWLWCLERNLTPTDYVTIVHAMLNQYESLAGPLDERTLSFYWAAALFRVGAIHAFRADTACYSEALWRLVPQVLQHGRRIGDHAPKRAERRRMTGPNRAKMNGASVR